MEKFIVLCPSDITLILEDIDEAREVAEDAMLTYAKPMHIYKLVEELKPEKSLKRN